MQTFLIAPEFQITAKCLDTKRLGKQRVEAFQIINCLEGRSNGWKNHPAVKMWENCVPLLKRYYNIMLAEWISRGYKNTMKPFYDDCNEYYVAFWYNDERLYSSHRSNLLRKDPVYYGQFGWKEPNNLPYFWPTKHYDNKR